VWLERQENFFALNRSEHGKSVVIGGDAQGFLVDSQQRLASLHEWIGNDDGVWVHHRWAYPWNRFVGWPTHKVHKNPAVSCDVGWEWPCCRYHNCSNNHGMNQIDKGAISVCYSITCMRCKEPWCKRVSGTGLGLVGLQSVKVLHTRDCWTQIAFRGQCTWSVPNVSDLG
jgi:hypothetical protein